MLKLEDVRLTPYETTAIPAGFKVVGNFKVRRAPSPWPYNFYSRVDGAQHEIFHLLADAHTKHPHGYTVEALKALFTDEADKLKVDEIIDKFKSSWNHRYSGFDLVSDEATGTHFMLIYRDPRTHYAKEVGLEEDYSQTAVQAPPNYFKKVPQMIEDAKNPKPVAEKTPKAPREAGATGGRKKAAPVSTAPAGGFLAAFVNVAAKHAGAPGDTIAAIFENAVSTHVDPNAMQVSPDDPAVKVIDGLHAIIDSKGLENAGVTVDYIARYQKESSIKGGFYKICKDLAEVWSNHLKTAAKVEQPVAATA